MSEAESGTVTPGVLKERLRALRRRWRWVLVTTVLAVLAALAWSLASTPLYASSADVILEPVGTDVASSSGTKIPADEIATQTQVVTSLPVARVVQQQAGLTETPDLTDLVRVQAVGTSRIIRITAQDTSAERAARTANTVAAAYLQFREADSIGRYDQARRGLVAEQQQLQEQLDGVETQLAETPRDRTLQSERRRLLADLATTATSLSDLEAGQARAGSGGLLLREAVADDDPVSPQTMLNLVLGGLLGLLLGIGVALLRDRLDDAVHDEATVEEALAAPVIGRIPRWSDSAHRDRLVTLLDPRAPASEEYQRLATNLRFMLSTDHAGDSGPGSVVLTTSGQQDEGKTSTSCNLAVAAARLGLDVVLVDADLRRPSVAGRFGLGNPPGLSDLLIRHGSAASAALDVGVDNLRVVPAGTLPPNPAALLGSERLPQLLAELAVDADVVVVDSPPVTTGADTLELARVADLVLVVAREGRSRRHQLTQVSGMLRQLGVTSLGVVLNGLPEAPAGRRYGPYGAAPEEPVSG